MILDILKEQTNKEERRKESRRKILALGWQWLTCTVLQIFSLIDQEKISLVFLASSMVLLATAVSPFRPKGIFNGKQPCNRAYCPVHSLLPVLVWI